MRSKFGNTSTRYGGRLYHSVAEATYAQELDWRKKAGEVKDWEAQKKYELRVNGHLVTTHYLDFRVTLADDSIELVEVKGYATPEWKIKRNLLLALLDELEPDGAEYLVVKAYGRQGNPKWTKQKHNK